MAVVTTPYKNAPEFVGEIQGEYILVIQKGNNTGATGRAEMMRITLAQLQAFINKGFGSAWRFRGAVSALPNDPITNDYFLAASTFISGGKTYQINHLYGYNGSTWSDISGLLEQYATVEALAELDDKVDALIGSGISFKGRITYAELMQITPSSSNIGWEYYVTDKNSMYVSDGIIWIPTTKIAQTTGQSEIELMSQKAITDVFNNLQAQVANVNSEIDNIEALIGGDAQVENTDPTEGESLLAQSRLIHHVNLLPNGEFGRVGARSVAWNQLMPEKTTLTNNGITFSIDYANLKITMSGTATANARLYLIPDSLANGFKGINGHKYAVIWNLSNFTEGYASFVNNGGLDSSVVSSTRPQGWIVTQTDNTKGSGFLIQVNNGETINKTIDYPTLHDLTTMGEYDSSLTDAQNLANFKAKFQSSYPYNTGTIYNLNPSGFRIRGINLWDEEMEVGKINDDGTEGSANDRLRSKNYIPLKSNTSYYVLCPVYGTMWWYDANKNCLGYTNGAWSAGGGQITSAVGACYGRFSIASAYGTTYNNDIQLCLNSLPTSVKTVYHSYDGHIVDTPQIADGHYINENCYDYVENVVEDGVPKGKKHTVVGIKDLGSCVWTWNSEYSVWQTQSLNGLAKPTSSSQAIPDILCGKYKNEMLDKVNNRIEDKIISGVSSAGNMRLYDSSFNSSSNLNTLLAGVMYYYKLATETITDVEPLRSFGISDYCTVEPITPQTELVNRIDVPFSVKTVSANTLIEQIKQNTADIAEEKATRTAQVSALDKRVTNLELKTGDQFDVDYPSSTYGMNVVPSNVEPYAKVKKLRGVSRAENQQFNNASLHVASGSATISSGVVTVSGNAIVDESPTFKTASGHIYLFAYSCKNGISGTTDVVNYHEASATRIHTIPSSSGYQQNAFLFTSNGTTDTINFRIYNYSSGTMEVKADVILTDLTLYFNGNIPSNAQTIADIQTNYPELLIPSDYDAGSLVSTEYSGARSTSINLWDEQVTLNKWLNFSTGEIVDYNGRWVSTNYQKCKPSTEYYHNLYFGIAFYDSNKNFIASGSGNMDIGTIISPANAYFYKLGIASASYDNNLQFCLASEPDRETYHPHDLDTLSLPTPITLRSAGSVAEEFYLKTGEVTKPLGSVDLGTLDWNYDSGRFSSSAVADMDASLSFNMLPNFAISKYVGVTVNQALNNPDKSIYKYQNMVGIIDSAYTSASDFKTAMSGVILYYEKATPTTEQLTPVLDPFVKVEPNGTIKAVQSQTPEIDSAMTVEYMAS